MNPRERGQNEIAASRTFAKIRAFLLNVASLARRRPVYLLRYKHLTSMGSNHTGVYAEEIADDCG